MGEQGKEASHKPTNTSGDAMTKEKGIKAVVIGGGTGGFVILSGLKNYANVITAVVSMSDDGGSTGQLRDELGVLPPGDIRQCLVALSESPKVRDLFNYRFDEGALKGHSFGNLFLTALEKMTGDFREGVRLSSEILQIKGRVEPITTDKVILCIKDGKAMVRHEHNIDDREFNLLRPEIWLDPKPTANPEALKAIKEADIIVIAPGSLYTSLGAILVVPGVGTALKRAKGKKIYVSNLVNKPGQTDGFSPTDFADELERMAGEKFLDVVLYNNHRPNADLLKKYASDGELPVEQPVRSESRKYKLNGANLLSDSFVKRGKGDKLKRTLIRHDSDKTARRIMKEFFS